MPLDSPCLLLNSSFLLKFLPFIPGPSIVHYCALSHMSSHVLPRIAMPCRLIPYLTSNVYINRHWFWISLCAEQGGHVAWVAEMWNRVTLDALVEELLKTLAEGHHDAFGRQLWSQRLSRGISCLSSYLLCSRDSIYQKLHQPSRRVISCIASSYTLLKVFCLQCKCL